MSEERVVFVGKELCSVLPSCRNNPKVKNMQILEFHGLEQSVRITAQLVLRGDGKLLAAVSFSVVVVSGF